MDTHKLRLFVERIRFLSFDPTPSLKNALVEMGDELKCYKWALEAVDHAN